MIYRPAFIFSRLAAVVIDHLLLFVLMIMIYQHIFHGDINNIQLDMRLYIYFFLINFLYFFLFELFFQKTVGKKILNIQVITVDHQKPKLLNIFLRNLLRPIDMIGFYLIGLIFIVFTPLDQRLGDIFGQTYVVNSLD